MVASSRGILAIGLGLTGLAILVAPTLGQAPAQDGAVRKAANPTSAAMAHADRAGHRHGRSRARFQELREGQAIEQGI